MPAVCQPALEQFICAWPMIPDGDRRHDAESGEPEDEPLIAIPNEQVMAEFILRNKIEPRQRHFVRLHPREDYLERREFRELCFRNHGASLYP
jgi:hypothetical protein